MSDIQHKDMDCKQKSNAMLWIISENKKVQFIYFIIQVLDYMINMYFR